MSACNRPSQPAEGSRAARPRRLRAALVGAGLVALLAGCGDDLPEDLVVPDPAPEEVEERAARGVEYHARRGNVEVRDDAFEPDEVEVIEGGRVEWSQVGTQTHVVTFDDRDSGELGVGDDWERTFTEVGTYDYACAIHPEMTGTVEVYARE